MIYEEKKAIVIHSILEASKLKRNQKIILHLQEDPLSKIELLEVVSIIEQFQQLNKLKVVSSNTKDPLPMLKGFYDNIGTPEKYIEISDLDIEYFKNELKKLSPHSSISKSSSKDTFYIEFSSDRRVLLNGKIDLAKPDFGETNEAIFKFLFEHPNQVFTKLQIEQEIKMDITQKFDKIVENLGFRRGLKATFFDISEKSSTIKFKNPVIL